MNWHADSSLMAAITGQKLCEVCHKAQVNDDIFGQPCQECFRLYAHDELEISINGAKYWNSLHGRSKWRTRDDFMHRFYFKKSSAGTREVIFGEMAP
jgi:hypothetical protein